MQGRIHTKATVVVVAKLHASRSQQNHATWQHEQCSSGELNVLRDFSVQTAATFSCVMGSVRYFDFYILHFFVNITGPFFLLILRRILLF
jgi:hypothetical protein